MFCGADVFKLACLNKLRELRSLMFLRAVTICITSEQKHNDTWRMDVFSQHSLSTLDNNRDNT